RLLEPERSSGGQRRYSEADVERVLTVRRLVAEGFTLPTAAARVRGGDGALPAPAGGDDRLEQILQAVPEGIWVGHGGVITYANRRMLEMLGRTHDELIGVSAFDFVDPDDLPTAKATLGRLQHGPRQVLALRLA